MIQSKNILFTIYIVFFQLGNGFAQAIPQIIGQGAIDQVIVTTSNTQSGTNGANTLSEVGYLPNPNAAARFLSQASIGATYDEIIALTNASLEEWIDQQMAYSRGFNCVEKVTSITNIKNAGNNNPSDIFAYQNFWDYAFWEYTLTNDDVLRQRIAFALSEILVISHNSSFGQNPYAFASYYDLLLDHAFGNYYDLLRAVTFHPAMGLYLTYMNNPKQHIENGQVIFPDENYAREVMQLFTIGLFELNLDGTHQLDAQSNAIPTYDNEDIAEFAKIFTGLTFNSANSFPGSEMQGQLSYGLEMKMFDEFHEPGPKQLLKGTLIPQRATVDGIADIEDALTNLFQHPNIGPFVGKLLIQRLVTSNPSPAYVTRVAEAFNGNSEYSSIRGDLKAVIKAILLDEEARDCAAQTDDSFGMLREPFLRYLQICRSFEVSNNNGHYRNAMAEIVDYFGQKIFNAPSVFNFFQPDYQPIGPVEEAGLVAPVFQITNTQTIAGYMNALNRWLMFDDVVDDWGYGFNDGSNYIDNLSKFNFTEELTLTDDDQLPALISRLNLILAHGALSQRSKDLLLKVLEKISLEGSADIVERQRQIRVKIAVFLIMSNPEYLINR